MCPPLGLHATGHSVPARATIHVKRPAPSYSTGWRVSAAMLDTLEAGSYGRAFIRAYPRTGTRAARRVAATQGAVSCGPGGGHWRQWNVPTDLRLAHVAGIEPAALVGLRAGRPRDRRPLVRVPRPPACRAREPRGDPAPRLALRPRARRQAHGA